MSYRYLMASMPLLVRRGAPPMSAAEYVSLLAQHLSADGAAVLVACGLFAAHLPLLEAIIDGGGRAKMDDGAANDGGGRVKVDGATGDGVATGGYGATGDGVTTDDDSADAQTAASGEAMAIDAVLAEWRAFDGGLRGEIGRLRATTLKVEVDIYWPKLESFIYIEELRRIFQQTNPMTRELHIYDLRWDFLDELAATRTDELQQAIIYYLKLLLLERLAAMTPAVADKKLASIYDRCRSQFQDKLDQLQLVAEEHG